MVALPPGGGPAGVVDPKPKLNEGLFGAGVVDPGATDEVEPSPEKPDLGPELPVEAPKILEDACAGVAEGAEVVAPPNKLLWVPDAVVVAGF